MSKVAPEVSRKAPELSPGDIAAFARRHAFMIACSVMLATSIAAASVLVMKPLYKARSVVFIDTKIGSPLRDPKSEVTISLDSSEIESQIALLKSEGVALAVIHKLNLHNEPEFTETESLLGRKTSPSDPDQRLRFALRGMATKLDVRRVGLSYAIEITFVSTSPQRATAIANAIAEAFVQDQLDTRTGAARQGSEWLESRINQLRQLVNIGARRVQEFKSRHDYRLASPREPGGSRDRAAEANPLAMLRAATSPDGDTRHDQTTLEELESISQTYRRIYESYLMAYAEIMQKQSYPIANARIITRATLPDGRSHPKSGLVVLLGSLLGLLGGFGAAAVRHGLDRRVASGKNVGTLGTTCLAEVPRVRRPAAAVVKDLGQRSASAMRRALGTLGRGATGNESPLLGQGADTRRVMAQSSLVEAPFAAFGVAVKTLRTAMEGKAAGRKLKTIGIVAQHSGEGATFIATSLAQSFVTEGARTLLVDANEGNPAVTRAHSDRTAETEDCCCRKETACGGAGKSLIVRGHGKAPDVLLLGNCADIDTDCSTAPRARAQRLSACIKRLAPRYNYIVVDLPGVRDAADGVLLSATLDGTVLVVDAEQTTAPQASEAVAALQAAKARLLGVVVNRAA